MKRITPEKVLQVLQTGENAVQIEEDLREKSNEPLKRMLKLAQ